MVAGERPTVADFQEVLGDHGIELRRNGAEWAGPCPLCGGEDRFHVADHKGYARIGCRGCIDGEPEDNRNQRYGEIMALLWPRPSKTAAMSRKAHKPSSNRPGRTAKPNPTTTAQAAELWAATVKCEDTPAQTYLVGRRAWPEREPAPLTVGWLAKEQAPAFVGRSLPRMAAGAIVYAQTDACATLQAVQVEAISPDGQRLDRTDRPDPWRQNYGSKAGAFFQADRMAPRGLVLCEGPRGRLGGAVALSRLVCLGHVRNGRT